MTSHLLPPVSRRMGVRLRMRATLRRTTSIAVGSALGVTVLAACAAPSVGTPSGSLAGASSPPIASATASTTTPGPVATESNPPGDIPDNQVFVAYLSPDGFTVRVPEGWARSTLPGGVSYTDKLNSVAIAVTAVASAPTTSSVLNDEVPTLTRTVPRFSLTRVSSVTRPAGTAVLITYRADSATDPVTGKVVRDAVERYLFWRGGHQVALTLTGPVGADNVDPWKTVTSSLRWTA